VYYFSYVLIFIGVYLGGVWGWGRASSSEKITEKFYGAFTDNKIVSEQGDVADAASVVITFICLSSMI